MQLRFAALFAAAVLFALSAVFATTPVSPGDAAATTAYVVVEPAAYDCPWEATGDAA
jgi:hypothetical protein